MLQKAKNQKKSGLLGRYLNIQPSSLLRHEIRWQSFNTQPAGLDDLVPLNALLCFNTQPPEGG
ncbi:hypothetical protein HMPREF2596_03840 [Neisseria sp. HMSC078C12]|nr:hypothetical protein HMPREF2596_03840 [Neisseria sp. HMSC078C12]